MRKHNLMKYITAISFLFMMISLPAFVVEADSYNGEPYDHFNDHYVWEDLTNPNKWIQEENGSWWFSFGNGTYAKDDWYYIDNTAWYHFDKDGWMDTGWIQDNGKWYYLNESGAMETGWTWVGTSRYYLDESGAMATGWVQDGHDWYYYKEDGQMQTGWIQDGDTWYYCYDNGRMALLL